MTKIILKKTTSAIFLAIVLVAGTFAAISPSFIIGVNAQGETYDYGMNDRYDEKSYGNSYEQDSYGKDRDYDKSKKDSSNSVSIKKLKCNNINVNVNGLELDVLPSFLSGELGAETQEGTTDASSFRGNGADGSEINDFRFICINNNNNTVIEEEPSIPPVEDECVLCFLEANVPSPIEIEIGPDNIVNLEALLDLDLVIGQDLVLTIFDLCRLLEGLTPLLTDSQLRALIDFLGIEITAEAEVDLIDCLLEAGIIIEGV